MARPKKGPWRRAWDNCWYTTKVGGKKPVKLADADATYQEAFDIYCQYHGTAVNGQKRPKGPLLTVSYLIDEYLEWCAQNRSHRTHVWYRDYLQKFHKFHGSKLQANRLAPHHVDQWVLDDYKGLSASHRKGAYRSIYRVMNWACKARLITFNPLQGMATPSTTPREVIINGNA